MTTNLAPVIEQVGWRDKEAVFVAMQPPSLRCRHRLGADHDEELLSVCLDPFAAFGVADHYGANSFIASTSITSARFRTFHSLVLESDR